MLEAMKIVSQHLERNGFKCVDVQMGRRRGVFGLLGIFHGNLSTENLSDTTVADIHARIEEAGHESYVYVQDKGIIQLRDDELLRGMHAMGSHNGMSLSGLKQKYSRRLVHVLIPSPHRGRIPNEVVEQARIALVKK